MKKQIAWILLVSLLITLAGCGAANLANPTEPMETQPTSEPAVQETSAMPVCAACGREIESPEDQYGDLCWVCYCESNGLCISCREQPSAGLGPSAMECEACYNWDSPIFGTFYSDFENVKIEVTRHDYFDFCLTYTDLTSGITLENIPLAYYNMDEEYEKMLMFVVDDSYPEHSGYVELCWSGGMIDCFSYNALIEGLEDSGGFYSTMTKEQ